MPPLFCFQVPAMNACKLHSLAWKFFWISAVTLGGGMAMVPVMQREFVEKQGWLTDDEMVEIIAVTHSLPGVIAVNMAVVVGYRLRGVAGAVASAFSAVLAPFAAIVFVAAGRSAMTGCAALDNAFLGVRAAVTAMILVSAVKLGKGILVSPVAWALASTGFVACALFGVDVTLVILLGALVGIAYIACAAVKRRRE